jgi:hypothetical protein
VRRLLAATAIIGAAAAATLRQSVPPLGVLLALGVGAAAEAYARSDPAYLTAASLRPTGYWIGPALATLAGVLGAGQLPLLDWRLAAVFAGLLVGLQLFLYESEIGAERKPHWLPVAAAVAIYLVAFELLAALYGRRADHWVGTLATTLLTILLTTLMALALFRTTPAPSARVWQFAAVIGLGVGEIYLALTTWQMGALLGGACLLLFFYLTSGLCQALLEETLDRRLLLEYLLVGLIGGSLLLSASPWRP